MRYVQGIRSIIEVPFKKKPSLCIFLLLLVLVDGHLLSALSTSTGASGLSLAFTIPRPTLTVNVIEVSIVNSGGTPVPEVNNAPFRSIFVSPFGSSPSKANGLDVIFSGAPTAPKVGAGTTTLTETSTMANSATPSIAAAASASPAPASVRNTPRHGHIVFECIALAALCSLVGMLTSRITTIYPHRRRLFESGEHALRWLALLIPIFGLFFVISSVMLIDVWDDDTTSRCRAATFICLIFYFCVKVFEYLFMIERAHQLRRRKRPNHLDDSWYVIEFITIIVGFGGIAFFAFTEPEYDISSTDGLCRIGLPPHVAISLLAFDVIINIVLAVHYCVLAWRVSPLKSVQEVFRYLWAALPFKSLHAASNDHQKIRKFQIGRAILGLFAITVPTVANLYILAYVHGHEQGWVCFSVCISDITWGVMVVHWLTSKPSYSVPAASRSPRLPSYSVPTVLPLPRLVTWDGSGSRSSPRP